MYNHENWIIGPLLPNVELSESFETDFLAIVPYNDYRIEKIKNENTQIKCFIDKFRDQYGNRIHPSIMILRSDIPDFLRNNESMMGLRNIFAISCLIKSFENKLRHPHGSYILFSDYFDIYPISLSMDKKCLISSSPAVKGISEIEAFKNGETNPGLPRSLPTLEPDETIIPTLKKIWHKRYVSRRKRGWETQVLFRSLEMAYQAMSLPSGNNSSIYDHGSRIALWVSAFEVLAHPKKEKVNKKKVIKLLDNISLHKSRLNGRYYSVQINKTKTRVNLIKKLYDELYNVRNDFLHGNKVSTNHLFPFKKRNRHDLKSYAPVIYKAVLLSFLGNFYLDKNDSDKYRIFKNCFYKLNFEEALLSAIKDRD